MHIIIKNEVNRCILNDLKLAPYIAMTSLPSSGLCSKQAITKPKWRLSKVEKLQIS